MQNKANFKMGNINISTATLKAYGKEQRTMSNEHYSKQTQSNPISNAEAVQWCEKSHPTGLFSAFPSCRSILVETSLRIGPFFRKTNPICRILKSAQPSVTKGIMKINRP
jgi:hypothetical protein